MDNMLDISIKNIDKLKSSEIDELFTNKLSIYEKFDGTKVTILRNNKDYDPNNFNNNWIVSYKGNIFFYEEFSGMDDEEIKNESIGISQYKFIMDFLYNNHHKFENIPKNTELFVEFIQDKPTLTRDYDLKHTLILIGYGESNYEIKGGTKLITNPITSTFNPDDVIEMANKVGMMYPPLIFEGYFNSIENILDGINEDFISKKYILKHKNEDLFDLMKMIFTNFNSIFDGIPEGVVIHAENNIYKILQKDQHDKETRMKKASKYKMEFTKESKYFKTIQRFVVEKYGYDEITDIKSELKDLRELLNDISITIDHDKKTAFQIKEDIMLNAKTWLSKRQRGNNGAFIQGRFQPPTKAHIKIIEDALDEFDYVVVGVVKGRKKYDKKSPFDIELIGEMLDEVFGNKVKVIKVGNGNLTTNFNKINENINIVICGSDRYDAYKNQTKNIFGVDVKEIRRTDDDISATVVRESLINDDERTFEKNMDIRLHSFYDDLRDELV